MATLPLALDIADMAMRRDAAPDRFDLDAVALELRDRHPDAAASHEDIAAALRDLVCWRWIRGRRPR